MFSEVRDVILSLSGIEITLLDNDYINQFKLSMIQKKKLVGFLASLDNREVYIAYIGSLEQTPKQFSKFDDNIKEKLGLPVIYWFDKLTTQNKRALIKYRIPFLLSNKDLFLPFNYLRVTKEPQVVTEVPKITPAIQEIMIAIILDHGENLSPQELSKVLEVPGATVYRAFQIFERLGLIESEGSTRNKSYQLSATFPEFVQNAIDHMNTPILREYTLEFEEQLELLHQVELMQAGDTALASVTQVNAISEQTYAVWKKQFNAIEKNEQWKTSRKALREPIKLQVWSYNPIKLARIQRGQEAEVVDSLSLALTISAEHDPRLEQASEALLSEVTGGRQ
jgi:DNA-binding transcriptional regulator YhcF (GntR family)